MSGFAGIPRNMTGLGVCITRVLSPKCKHVAYVGAVQEDVAYMVSFVAVRPYLIVPYTKFHRSTRGAYCTSVALTSKFRVMRSQLSL